MNGMARAPQDAVDGLNSLAAGAQNDERNGVLLGQRDLHHTTGEAGPMEF
jgi:hypothetical protein